MADDKYVPWSERSLIINELINEFVYGMLTKGKMRLRQFEVTWRDHDHFSFEMYAKPEDDEDETIH